MKRWILWLALCLMLAGCAGKMEKQSIQQTEPFVSQTTAAETEPGWLLQEDEADFEAYRPVLEIYHQALKEKWNPGQCAENGISILTAYIGETETPLQNLCFAFHDLDSDGDRELLIAPTVSNGFVDEMVFEAYDHTDGEIRLIFTGWERNRYYLCMEADGTVWFANEGSGGAAVSCWFYSKYDGTELKVEKSLIFDADTDSESPWFTGSDYSWDLMEMEHIDEALALETIASFDAMKCNIHRGFSHQYTFDRIPE